ncbi:hypothetical protein P6F26_09440 [Roseibacterium sp. SDUM158017]|uniref:hypothetical protein n=1 Tax=Roseicyclus salinarum TaxID=3036773 RepID=UPI0024156BBE|nr:hypothetical protein [Roseibacterium sp. SDUM158017]MDG4648670.1 hypothetical protein [Roseibacterium sp. SDUM158017]
MLFFGKTLSVWHYVVAGSLAVVVPMALAWVLSMTVASGCYDSLCLLPLLMLLVPPCAAPVLAVLFAINRRVGRPVPDGWLPVVMISGVATQVTLSACALATASPEFRDIYFSDLLSVPQGFFVGITIGTVFWVSLHAVGRKSTHA